MSEPNKDGTDIMMALLMGLSGPRASKAWNESQQIKAESFLTMAEHWINQTAEENARLKAEVERLTAFTTRTIFPNEELQSENARLKAKVSDLECDAETRYRQGMDDEYEIEWLNKITHGLMKEKEQLQAQVERVVAENSHLHKGIYSLSLNVAQLKDEVERLTKAGDAMISEWASGDEKDAQNFLKALAIWNAAKEGKPRA